MDSPGSRSSSRRSEAAEAGSRSTTPSPRRSTPPKPPRAPLTWRTTWRFGFGIFACAFVGWFAYVKGGQVPILSGVQLASHEFGHFATTFLPQVLYFMGGSLFEIIMPLGLAGVFLWQTRDLLGVSVCLAWAAASCASVATYIADAPFQQLALIGGEHDWAFILGPEGLDAMASADAIAMFVRGLGVVFLLAGFAAALAGPWWVRRRDARDARERALAATPAPAPATAVPQAPNPDGWAVVPPWEAGDDARSSSRGPQEPEAGGKPEP